MSGFSKIVVVILAVLSLLYVKDKFFSDFKFDFDIFNKLKSGVKESSEVQIPSAAEPEVKKEKIEEKKEVKEQQVSVYFLGLNKEGTGIFQKVARTHNGKNRLYFSVKELLKGPTMAEKSQGAYTEIPKGTKLLGIDVQGDNVIINLSSDFQYGGGTDSIYSRMRQLIKTALANAPGKNIYLYLDGKQVDIIGGEGIMVSQPLNENSLDD